MTLDGLKTPYEKRLVIQYSADGQNVIHKQYLVQHIIGPLYKSQEIINEYDESECDIFLFYEGVECGLVFKSSLQQPEHFTPEQLLAAAKAHHCDSIENLLGFFESLVQSGQPLTKAEIDFTAQVDFDRGKRYMAYYIDYYEKQKKLEEQEQQRHQDMLVAEQAAQKEKERVRREKEDEIARALYLGWADTMPRIKFWRVHSVMEKKLRVDGIPMTRRDFIVAYIQKGWQPLRAEVTVYPRGDNWEESDIKTKEEFRLQKDGHFFVITKTEFDFAEYLLAHLPE